MRDYRPPAFKRVDWETAVLESDLTLGQRFAVQTIGLAVWWTPGRPNHGITWISQGSIARGTRLSRKTVNRAVQAAVRAGLLIDLGCVCGNEKPHVAPGHTRVLGVGLPGGRSEWPRRWGRSTYANRDSGVPMDPSLRDSPVPKDPPSIGTPRLHEEVNIYNLSDLQVVAVPLDSSAATASPPPQPTTAPDSADPPPAGPLAGEADQGPSQGQGRTPGENLADVEGVGGLVGQVDDIEPPADLRAAWTTTDSWCAAKGCPEATPDGSRLCADHAPSTNGSETRPPTASNGDKPMDGPVLTPRERARRKAIPPPPFPDSKPCRRPGCDMWARAKGLCSEHYQEYQRTQCDWRDEHESRGCASPGRPYEPARRIEDGYVPNLCDEHIAWLEGRGPKPGKVPASTATSRCTSTGSRTEGERGSTQPDDWPEGAIECFNCLEPTQGYPCDVCGEDPSVEGTGLEGKGALGLADLQALTATERT